MSKIEAAIVQISAAPRRTGTVKTLKPRGIILSYPRWPRAAALYWIDGTCVMDATRQTGRLELDVTEILALFDRDERQEIAYPGMTREVFPTGALRAPRAGDEFCALQPAGRARPFGAIAEQIEYFTRLDRPFNWKVYAHDRPADLVQRPPRGFVVDETDAVMVLDVGNAPSRCSTRPQPNVRRLTDPAQLADVVAVLEPVWETAISPGSTSGWAAATAIPATSAYTWPTSPADRFPSAGPISIVSHFAGFGRLHAGGVPAGRALRPCWRRECGRRGGGCGLSDD